LFLISPKAKDNDSFFAGASDTRQKPGFLMLTFSLAISWIFAKSITNAANLGLEFGIVGGLAYAVYYLSFLVAGIVIYQMRKEGGFASIHQFLERRFGRPAIFLFSILIGIRLLNEVWSNTAVIGSYFGASGSPQYIASVLVFTGLTLAYSLRGGLRSSLVTDMIQMSMFGILLFVVLGTILPKSDSVGSYLSSGEWSMPMGLNLLLVVFLQIFSYPFHDPIMTDRGFISDERTTLRSFVAATVIGFFAILLFSFLGIYGRQIGVSGQAAVEVSKTMGVFMMLITNFIMVTSAASTLDSTFSSVSKLFVVDIGLIRNVTISKGRLVMTFVTVAGSLPLLLTPEIISATTISGTMVLGLAPIFLFWRLPAPKLSFHLSFWTGIVAGIVLIFQLLPESWFFTSGKYADLLTINVYGTILSLVLYLMPYLMKKASRKQPNFKFGPA
jgi:Na+/proline symporter